MPVRYAKFRCYGSARINANGVVVDTSAVGVRDASTALMTGIGRPGLAMLGSVCQAGGMKKQLSDQQFHDRRYQERKRAEAAKRPVKKKVVGGESGQGKQSGESRVPSGE